MSDVRQKFLNSLKELHKTRLVTLEHEVQRLGLLSTKASDNQRVRMFEENIESTKRAINDIDSQLEIGMIVVPRVKEGEILFHGRITDENGHGIKNITISLLIEGKSLDVMGKSDASGYYSIVLPQAIVDKIKEKELFVYLYFGTMLVHKSEDGLRLMAQENNYEVSLNKDELEMIHMQEKDKKESRRIRKNK